MLPVLTPAEMAAATPPPSPAGSPETELVERAGGAVARAARRLLGGTYGRRVVVVCREGQQRRRRVVAGRAWLDWGARVDRLRPGGRHRPTRFDRALGRADLAVDAMFGTGFRGPLDGRGRLRRRGPVGRALRPCWRSTSPRESTGSPAPCRGPAVEATATVCLAALKPGLRPLPRRRAGRRGGGGRHRHRPRSTRRPPSGRRGGRRGRLATPPGRSRATSGRWGVSTWSGVRRG